MSRLRNERPTSPGQGQHADGFCETDRLRHCSRRRPRPRRRRSRPISLAGKTVQMIIGFGPGGGYDLGRTVARHIGRHLPGQAQRRSAEHAGRRQLCRHQPHLQRRAEGWHGARHHRPRCRLGAAHRRDRRTLRRHQTVVDRKPDQGNQRLHRLSHRPGEDRAGSADPAVDRRRHRSRHRYARLPEGAQRADRRQVQGGRRVSSSAEVFLAMERGEVDGICESPTA